MRLRPRRRGRRRLHPREASQPIRGSDKPAVCGSLETLRTDVDALRNTDVQAEGEGAVSEIERLRDRGRPSRAARWSRPSQGGAAPDRRISSRLAPPRLPRSRCRARLTMLPVADATRAVPTIGATAASTPRTWSASMPASRRGSEVHQIRDRRGIDRDQRRDANEHERLRVEIRRLDRVRGHACEEVEDGSVGG